MYRNRQLIALVGLAAAATILAFAFPVTAAPLISPPRLQPAFWVQTGPAKVTLVIQANSGQVREGDGGNFRQPKLARSLGEDCHATGRNCGTVAEGSGSAGKSPHLAAGPKFGKGGPRV